MNCVTTSISSGSDFPIHGTLAVSTSALLRCTATTCGERLQNVCSGCQLRADAGGSTGRARIVGREPSGFSSGCSSRACRVALHARLSLQNRPEKECGMALDLFPVCQNRFDNSTGTCE